jgi:hypothetical protein
VEGDDDVERRMDAHYGHRTSDYHLRPRKPRDYSRLFVTRDDTGYDSLAAAQMSLKQGLRSFGNDGVAAVRKELQQLHDDQVIAPHVASTLTPEEKKGALGYLIF